MRGPKPLPITLDDDARDTINSLLAKASTPRRVAERCRILQLSDKGWGPTEIANKIDWGRQSVARLRARFREEGVAVLYDKPRSGRPRSFSPSAAR